MPAASRRGPHPTLRGIPSAVPTTCGDALSIGGDNLASVNHDEQLKSGLSLVKFV